MSAIEKAIAELYDTILKTQQYAKTQRGEERAEVLAELNGMRVARSILERYRNS